MNRLSVITAYLLMSFSFGLLPDPTASGECLSKSDLDSTLNPQCNLCWEPSSSERAPDRLPTFKPRRPRRPPDSRPHRFPKGRYKLAPKQKQTRLSSLHAKLRHRARLAHDQAIIVLDGNTIHIVSDRVRLRSSDAPELSEPDGRAAKQRLEELLMVGPVRIVRHGHDIYDRLVADVFVNGQNVAETLTDEGYAKTQQ